MTASITIAPILVALVTGTLVLLFRAWPGVQRTLSIAGVLLYAGFVAMLVREVVFAPDASALAYQLGGWRVPFGITLVADGLSVFMLGMTAIVAVYAVVFSVRFIDDANQRVYYHPLFHFLLLGATGAFLTGDLFNLFVWFEVMLMASYVFVAFYGGPSHTAAATRYVVLNIIGGVCMLLGVGGLYATTGTLNMADMAQQLARPDVDTAPVVGLSAFIFATFALKAGLVPFQFWVPSAYRAAPLPIAAMFAGATKKVGIYAIIRLYFTVFGNATVSTNVPGIAGESALAYLAPVLGTASILLGGIGAITSELLDGLFAYSSVGQVGFVAIPIGIAATTAPSSPLRHLGILAALVFALHHAVTKGLLFLLAGVVRDATGTTRLSELGGLGDRSPGFASVFLVGGLSLIGVPPLAGFFGKFVVFRAAATQFSEVVTEGTTAAIAAGIVLLVLLAGSVLTILYSTRAWMGAVWGDQTEAVRRGAIDDLEVLVLATLAGIVLAIGVGFEPVYQFADAAADAAIDTDGYVETVQSVDAGGETE
jgi:multicomponent Na+:H+ antiporter subunit D